MNVSFLKSVSTKRVSVCLLVWKIIIVHDCLQSSAFQSNKRTLDTKDTQRFNFKNIILLNCGIEFCITMSMAYYVCVTSIVQVEDSIQSHHEQKKSLTIYASELSSKSYGNPS